MHDHILIYAKNKDKAEINLLPRTKEMNLRYKNPDNDIRGPWKAGDFQLKHILRNMIILLRLLLEEL